MILFNYIKQNKEEVNRLYRLGVISVKTINYFEMYQFYLDALTLGSKQAAIAFARDNFDTTIARIYKAITLMESDI